MLDCLLRRYGLCFARSVHHGGWLLGRFSVFFVVARLVSVSSLVAAVCVFVRDFAQKGFDFGEVDSGLARKDRDANEKAVAT